jgi:galactokinase
MTAGPASAVATWFREVTGRSPEGVWCAPGRVNLIGEHTDYNEGFVAPIALAQRAFVAAAGRSDGRINLWSRQAGQAAVSVDDLGEAGGWAAYPVAAIRAMGEEGVDPSGLDLCLDSDVPIGAGLSSSAAITCATVLAVSDLSGASRSPGSLALAAQRAENAFVGAPVGAMDQMAAMNAMSDHVLFLDCRSLAFEQVPLPLSAAGLTLLAVDSRASHRVADGAYGERRAMCEEAARVIGVTALRDADEAAVAAAAERLGPTATRRARHVVTENRRVLEAMSAIRSGEWRRLGELLTASHRSLSDDFEVSVRELDVAVDAALGAGALGARMTGGGFGGSIVALVPAGADVVPAIRAAFAHEGFAEPAAFEIHPSGGARRISGGA